MKGFKLFLILIFLTASSAIAIGSNITINGTSALTCVNQPAVGGVSYDSNGNIAISYSCGTAPNPTPTPTPGPSPTPTPGPSPTPTPSPTPGSNGLEGIPLQYNTYNVHYNIPAGGSLLLNAAVASPNCTSASRVSFSVTAQQQSPRTDIVVKKTYDGTASPPTIADYQNFFRQTGVAPGQYSSNTTNGTFFWNFSGSGSGETVLIIPPIVSRSIPGFNVLDSYYMLLVNTESSRSTDVYVIYSCY